MRLCMFHPVDHPMERGWVGRIDGEHVVHLAAQTLQAFFSGGGLAREHAVYPVDAVRLLAPVLHPPSVRIFESAETFWFANPAAIVPPETEVVRRQPRDASPVSLAVFPRLAAVVGADEEIGGFTLFCEWRDAAAEPPKDRDFALGLGPIVVTSDEVVAPPTLSVRVGDAAAGDHVLDAFDWEAARALAAAGTQLYPGDVLASPAFGLREIAPHAEVELAADGLGTLRHRVRVETAQR